jgi:hypothetical protein
MSSDIRSVNVGTIANDGTGDAIRTAFTTVNDNFGNLDTRISTGNFGVVYSGTYIQANLTLASLGSTTTETLEVHQTANVAGNVQIANLTVNNSFRTSTLTTTGNAYIGSWLNVTDSAKFAKDVTIDGNLLVLGNSLAISTADLVVDDTLVHIHSPADMSPLTMDDGKDVGFVFHYYKGTDNHAALLWGNDSGSLEYYTSGVETNGNTFAGSYGDVKSGSYHATNTTPSTSTTTGAIVSAGGIAAAGNVHAYGFNGNLDGPRANVGQLSVSGTVVGSLYLNGADTIYINGSAVATSAASFAGGTVPGYSLFQSVLETRGNLYANSQVASTSTNTGALVVRGGAGVIGDIYAGSINAPIGTLAANTGNFTSVTVNNTTDSVGVTTGALVVKGGVGIAGNVYIGGGINNTPIGVYGPGVGNFLSIGATYAGLGYFSILRANATIPSTSTTTGSFIVQGGAGIAGNVYAGALYSDNVRFANGAAYVSTSIGATSEITANIPSGNNVGLSLTATGVTAATYGNTAYYPTFTVDNKGRVTSASTQLAAIPVTGTTGTGSANAVNGLTFASTNGVTSTVSAGTVTISTPQDLRSTAAPVFNGLTTNSTIIPGANATVNLGSPVAWFNNIYGVSSQAKYADLAENYISDGTPAVADVVVFGGTEEITLTSEFADTRVAGVISTNPAYLMNGDCYQGQPVALRGRVPCNVIGKVAKGDLLVTSTTPGCAISVGKDKKYGPAVFAKSLNDKDDDGIGQIEAVIL